jgi:hypothetical protein
VTVKVAVDGCAWEVIVCVDGESAGREHIEVKINEIWLKVTRGNGHERRQVVVGLRRWRG